MRRPLSHADGGALAATRAVGADLERRVAWFSHLLDAYDPGRLGRAVDVRTTALDHASRKAVPTMSAPTHHRATSPDRTPSQRYA